MAREVVDSFRVSLMLHHPSDDLASVTKAFGIEPIFCLKAGQTLGPVTRKSSVWFGDFRRGVGNDEFGNALEDFLAFLNTHRAFLAQFCGQGGEIELELSEVIAWDDGVLFDLHLEPFFLKALADNEVSLRVKAWSEETDDPAETIHPRESASSAHQPE